MDIRERLRSVPRSYEDFVDSTAALMEKDKDLWNKVIDYMDSNPDAGTGNILEVVVNHFGWNEPLEIIDDDLPFDEMTEEQINEELEKGYKDMLEGNMRPADEVFEGLGKELGVDLLISDNPEIRTALDKGIDDLEASRTFSRDEAREIIEEKYKELINVAVPN